MTMYAFYCHLDKPDFVRKEHVDAKWMAPEDMPTLDWAPADVPIMKNLLESRRLPWLNTGLWSSVCAKVLLIIQ